MSRWRFRLFVFFVNMCRACEWPRLIFPVAVRRTRFAAPLCVFSFGITQPFFCSGLWPWVFGLIALPKTESRSPKTNLLRYVSGRFRLSTTLMSLWPEDDEHLVPFHPGPCFNFANVSEILLQLFQDPCSQFTVSHFATAKPDRGFHFVAILKPLTRVLHAILVVVIVSSRSKLHFLDGNRYLLLLRLVCLLLRFVLILSKINDSANRRIGVRS